LNFTSLHHLQIIWGAKEALYKKYAGNFKDIRNEVITKKISRQLVYLTCKGQTEKLIFKELDTSYLVYTP